MSLFTILMSYRYWQLTKGILLNFSAKIEMYTPQDRIQELLIGYDVGELVNLSR